MISDLRNENVNYDELVDLFGIRKELNKKLGLLSGGTRQKVNVVSALMLKTPVLVCDEPTVGLDPASVVKLKKLLVDARNEGKTILVITHIINLVDELADHVFLLQDGNLNFSGTVNEIKERKGKDNLEEALALLMEEIESE
jgi:Cu-processing system ATP-binding protein